MAIYVGPFSPPTLAPETPPEPRLGQQMPPLTGEHRLLKIGLAAFEAFIALSTLAGAMFVVPSLPLDIIKRGPFTDFTVPALGLGVLCGGAALIAMLTAFAVPRLAAMAAMVGGAFMIVFELVEIYAIGFTAADSPNNPAAWLQVFFLAAGVVGVVLGARLLKAVTD
jgi:hypothetical protein